MAIFVDTSAIYAWIDDRDPRHSSAAGFLNEADENELLTHNYVILETVALVQSRLGREPALVVLDEIASLIRVAWVDAALHDAAVAAFRVAQSRSVSLVDRVSFELMRREKIEQAFAFDEDFDRAGFSTAP